MQACWGLRCFLAAAGLGHRVDWLPCSVGGGGLSRRVAACSTGESAATPRAKVSATSLRCRLGGGIGSGVLGTGSGPDRDASPSLVPLPALQPFGCSSDKGSMPVEISGSGGATDEAALVTGSGEGVCPRRGAAVAVASTFSSAVGA